VRISPDLLAAAAAGRVILAPNAELAAALFDAIERAHRAMGREIWATPKVRDFGSWAREQYALRQCADDALARQLSELEERELWRQVVAGSAGSQDLLDIGVAARAARRARRTVLEYAVPWPRVAADVSPETQQFLQWNRAFEARCRELQCIGTEVPLREIETPREAPVWIESPSWRPAARHWLASRAQLIVPEGSAPNAVSILHASTPSGELSAIAAWMHERLTSIPGFRAWIYVPGLTRRRGEIEDAFDAALAPERFALRSAGSAARYALAGGPPLAEYAPVRAALEVLQASVGAVSFAQFSSLLRAPELQESSQCASAAARIDLALRRHGPHEATLDGWLTLADTVARQRGLSAAPAVQRLRSTLTLLNARPSAQRMSEWIAVWVSALDAGPWIRRQSWSSTEFQAVQRFRELLAALAAAEAFFGSQPREAAQRILARSARETAFQPQTGVAPVSISGQLMDPWLHYDALWVSGLGEEQWPPPVEPVALLPVALQRAFGVVAADATSQLAMARDLLGRWQQRGAQCVFSLSDAADGRAAAPSPLLPAAPMMTATAAAHPHWLALKAQAPALERFLDEQGPVFTAGERTRGVATLRAQSRCAFRGFAEIRLAAEPLEQPVPGFNDRERGELVHHALLKVWSVLGDWASLQVLDAGAQRNLLDSAVGGAVRAICRGRDPGPRWRARERERLRNLLGKWLAVERARSPFSVESLEQDAPLARIAGLELRVRVDRIDRLEDGARVLIDYKTGAAAVDWRSDRPGNPQLPFYGLLFPRDLIAVAYGRVNAAESRFVAECERDGVFKPGRNKTSLEGAPNLSALIEVWARRIQHIAAAFAAGRAEVAPTAEACRSCVLQGLCRVPTVLQEPETHDE
jgi:probable DNA repair protein